MGDIVNFNCLRMGLTEHLDTASHIAAVIVDDRAWNTAFGRAGFQLTVDHLFVRNRHRLQLDRLHLLEAQWIVLARLWQLRDTYPRMTRHFSLPI